MDSISKRIQRLREQLAPGEDIGIFTVIFKDGSRQPMAWNECFYFVLERPDAVERVEGDTGKCGNLLNIINGFLPSTNKQETE